MVELSEILAKTQGLQSSDDPFQSAEVLWVQANRNVVEALHQMANVDQKASVPMKSWSVRRSTFFEVFALGLDWEVDMLNPYSSELAASFYSTKKTLVGDPTLLKRSTIDPKQADKWRTVTMPKALGSATVSLAHELGYDELPLALPRELVWLKPPKRHSSACPAQGGTLVFLGGFKV
jgi:hypothetical protein